MREATGNADSSRWSLPVAIGVTLLVFFSPASMLIEAGTVAWGWVLTGTLVTGLLFGLGPRTRPGRTIGRWFRAIGVLGRIVAITLAAALIWGWIFSFEPNVVLLSSFLAGSTPMLLVVEIIQRR